MVNTASRLCDQAEDGSILLTRRAYLDVETLVTAESAGAFELKGIAQPVDAMRLAGIESDAETS